MPHIKIEQGITVQCIIIYCLTLPHFLQARENSVQARMDVQFKAQEFKLAGRRVDNDTVPSVKLPYKNKDESFSIQTKLNPGATNVTLSLNNETYQISQGEQQIFVRSWNQSITCQNLFEDSDRQQTITFTIPEVTRETRASANISFENNIGRSDFEFSIQVVCPEDETEFCGNGGRCEEKSISCNCDGTGFYGEFCQQTCTPQSIEITGSDIFTNPNNMDYLGIFNKSGHRNGSQVYISRNGTQEITFRWLNDEQTKAALLDKDGGVLDMSSTIKTKMCLFEKGNFSANLQIRPFGPHKTCHDQQFACKDGSRCINESWLCDYLVDCGDKSDEDFDFCNRRAQGTRGPP